MASLALGEIPSAPEKDPARGIAEKDIPQLARDHGFEIGIEANHQVGCAVP
jgi:hypothetical protein